MLNIYEQPLPVQLLCGIKTDVKEVMMGASKIIFANLKKQNSSGQYGILE